MEQLKQSLLIYLPQRRRKPNDSQGQITGLESIRSAAPPTQKTTLREALFSRFSLRSKPPPELETATSSNDSDLILLEPPLTPRVFKFPCRAWGQEEHCRRCRERDAAIICQSPLNTANPAYIPPEVYQPCIVKRGDLISPPIVNCVFKPLVHVSELRHLRGLGLSTRQDVNRALSMSREELISTQSEESLVKVHFDDGRKGPALYLPYSKGVGIGTGDKFDDNDGHEEERYSFPSSLEDSGYFQHVIPEQARPRSRNLTGSFSSSQGGNHPPSLLSSSSSSTYTLDPFVSPPSTPLPPGTNRQLKKYPSLSSSATSADFGFAPTLNLRGGGKISSLSFLSLFFPGKRERKELDVERGKKTLCQNMNRMDWFLALQYGKRKPMVWREFCVGTKKMLEQKEKKNTKVEDVKVAGEVEEAEEKVEKRVEVVEVGGDIEVVEVEEVVEAKKDDGEGDGKDKPESKEDAPESKDAPE